MSRLLLTVLCLPLALFAADWMGEQIEADFSPFPDKSLTVSMLQETMKNPRIVNWHSEVSYMVIENGEARVKELTSSGWDYVADRLETVIREINRWQKAASPEKRLPDCTFLLSCSDGLDIDGYRGLCYPEELSVPLFVFSKRPNSKKLILFPDHGAMTARERVVRGVNAGNRQHSWEKKKEILFWRGAGTDGEYIKDKWKKCPRAHLTLQSLKHPNLIDAGLTSLPQVDGFAASHEILSAIGGLKPIVSIRDHMSYKYLMDVDGNSNGWDRCFWGLLSNSVLFKQEGRFQQWYYKALKPWEHYIPVRENLEDIQERLEWAKKHDAQAQAIAEEGRAVALKVFDRKAVFEYMRRALTEYNKRFK